MLSTESIITIIIVVVAVCALGYYCYTKLTSHEQYINTIHQRCQNLEIMLTQPPPSAEINNMFNTPSKKKEQVCENGMCYLKPIDEDDEDDEEEPDEDDSLAQEEIDRIMSTDPLKKKKLLLPSPPKSTIEEDVK